MIQEFNDSKGGRGRYERRERLYEAALTLFRAQGYEATTVAQITRRAGLAKGTFFNYFPAKHAVLRHLGAREIGRIGVWVLTSDDGHVSPLNRLRRLMRTLAVSLERDRELVCLIFQSGVSVQDLLAGDARGFSLQPMTSLLIRQAQRFAEINPDWDPDMLATILDALYLQQLVLWCEARDPYPLSDRLTGIVDLLLLGVTVQH